MLTLLTGGARSGKSSLAEQLAMRTGAPVVVICAGEALDDDMAARIRRHQDNRRDDWNVIEEPHDLVGAIRSTDADATLIVDCLTLWVSNRLEHSDSIITKARSAAEAAAARAGQTIVVTNEVGDGVVPATPLGRQYRDLLGHVNQIFADASATAYLVVAGRLLSLSRPGDVLDV